MEETKATNVKQVIVMRHDLKMRRGKQIAQGAHASMAFLTRRLQSSHSVHLDDFSPNARTWITGAFAKVCVRCNGEEELTATHDKAIAMGLEVHLITDSGPNGVSRTANSNLLGYRARRCCEDRPRDRTPRIAVMHVGA